jgi:hypothetical protein
MSETNHFVPIKLSPLEHQELARNKGEASHEA